MSAALAVAAIVAGWALAQHPRLLPGLTIAQAAAPRPTLVAVVAATAAGTLVLVPSLVLLFSLFLRGRLDAHPHDAWVSAQAGVEANRRGRLAEGFALGCLLAGAALMLLGDMALTRVAGVACLGGFAVSAFLAAATIPDDAG